MKPIMHDSARNILSALCPSNKWGEVKGYRRGTGNAWEQGRGHGRGRGAETHSCVSGACPVKEGQRDRQAGMKQRQAFDHRRRSVSSLKAMVNFWWVLNRMLGLLKGNWSDLNGDLFYLMIGIELSFFGGWASKFKISSFKNKKSYVGV